MGWMYKINRIYCDACVAADGRGTFTNIVDDSF